MKVKIELILNENGNTFLNYWDWYAAKDVSTQVIDGKIIYNDWVDERVVKREVTLDEFITLVKESVDNIPSTEL